MVALHSVDGAQEWQPSPLSRWHLGLGNKTSVVLCGIMHQEGWQGGGIALCRWGTRVAAQSTIEVAPWVGQQNKCGIVWYNAPGGVAGWWHCTL